MRLAPGSMRCRNTDPDSEPAIHRVPSCRGGIASAVARDPEGRPQAEGRASVAAMSHHLLDFPDGLGRIENLRARLGAIHDGVAAVQPKWILELVETLAGSLVAAIDDPAVSCQQRRGPQVTVAVPPIAGAAGGAARAEDARRGPVDLFLIFLRLQAFPVGRCRRAGLQPGFYRSVLGVEVGQIRDQILDDRHVGQGIDRDVALYIGAGTDACQAVLAVDIHGAGTAYSLAA